MANPDLMTGLGAACSIFLSSAGSVVASVQAGLFALRSGGGLKSFLPIVIAGVLSIYGIIIGVILCGQESISETDGYRNLSAGLVVGLACLSSGIGMASFLKHHMTPSTTAAHTTTRRGDQQEPLICSSPPLPVMAETSVGLLLVMVFLEAIGLYGLIVALILSSH